MLSIAFDPAAFPSDAFAADVTRLVDWVKSSSPIEQGGGVLLPGEVEEISAAVACVKEFRSMTKLCGN